MPRKKAAPTTSASYAAPTSTGARWGLMNLDTGQFTVLPTGGVRTTASAGTTAPRTRTRTRKTVATGQPAAQASAGGGPSMTPQAIGRRKQAERARRAKLQQQQQP